METHTLRGNECRDVWLDDQYLDPLPSLKYHNHSPDGFNWGYSGSGPAQLALAIVLKLTGKANGYQDFKSNVIAKLPHSDFEIKFEFQKCVICGAYTNIGEVCIECAKTNNPFSLDSNEHEYLPRTEI